MFEGNIKRVVNESLFIGFAFIILLPYGSLNKFVFHYKYPLHIDIIAYTIYIVGFLTLHFDN
jgi:hypothetical protein